MRKLFIVAIVSLLFSSCISYKYPYILEGSVIDYSYFTDKNFFITESNSVSFNYKTIGSVSVYNYSGYEVKKRIVYPISPSGYITPDKITYGNYKSSTIEDTFEKIYKLAIEKGGNGLINVVVRFVPAYTDIATKVFHSNKIEISGMIIQK